MTFDPKWGHLRSFGVKGQGHLVSKVTAHVELDELCQLILILIFKKCKVKELSCVITLTVYTFKSVLWRHRRWLTDLKIIPIDVFSTALSYSGVKYIPQDFASARHFYSSVRLARITNILLILVFILDSWVVKSESNLSLFRNFCFMNSNWQMRWLKLC